MATGAEKTNNGFPGPLGPLPNKPGVPHVPASSSPTLGVTLGNLHLPICTMRTFTQKLVNGLAVSHSEVLVFEIRIIYFYSKMPCFAF